MTTAGESSSTSRPSGPVGSDDVTSQKPSFHSLVFDDDMIWEGKKEVFVFPFLDAVFDILLSPRYLGLMLPILLFFVPACFGVLYGHDAAGKAADILLMALACVMLVLSCTKPWEWYFVTQEIRLPPGPTSEKKSMPDGQPSTEAQEATETQETTQDTNAMADKNKDSEEARRAQVEARRRASNELYFYEVLALMACILAPSMAALLLHQVGSRIGQFQKVVPAIPFKLIMVFGILVPLRVVFQCLKNRSLHLQRIVAVNPYLTKPVSPAQIKGLANRLTELEDQMLKMTKMTTGSGRGSLEARAAQTARDALQPDIDALNRAVRRYEKKATTYSSVTDERFAAMDGRISDVITLSAAAAQNSLSHGNPLDGIWAATAGRLMGLLLGWPISLCMVPLRGIKKILKGEVGQPGRINNGAKGNPDMPPGVKRNTGKVVARRSSDRLSSKAAGE